MIKAAIIGAGTAGTLIHAPFLATNPDVKLVAIADPIEERARSLARKFYVERTYGDALEMLEKEKPEIVHVATPQWLHHDHVIAAINAGANVLCEKPMANSLEECDDMIETAKKRKVKLMIGFMKRWNIGLEKVKEVLDNGELGKPFFAYAHHTLAATTMYGHGKNSIPSREQMSGGGIALGLLHYADVFRWLIGDADFVYGAMSNTMPKLIDWENFAVVNIDFFNGVHGTIVLGAGPTYNFEQGEEGGIFCAKGNIHFKMPGYLNFSAPIIKTQNSAEVWRQIPLRTDLLNLSHWQYKREIDYWVDCVKNDKQPCPSGEDGRKAQEIIYALYESWYSGNRIKLPLKRTPPLESIFSKLTSDSCFT